MKFLSEMEKPRKKRAPQHHFPSEDSALQHLKACGIEPSLKRFVVISERHYGDKSFDALDYLMFSHDYEVNFV